MRGDCRATNTCQCRARPNLRAKIGHPAIPLWLPYRVQFLRTSNPGLRPAKRRPDPGLSCSALSGRRSFQTESDAGRRGQTIEL